MSTRSNPTTLIAQLGPEAALLAAMIRDAVECCRQGDAEAALWLRLAAPRWLRLFATDPDAAYQRLLAVAGIA